MSVPTATSSQNNQNAIFSAIAKAPPRGVSRIMGNIDSSLKNNSDFMFKITEIKPPVIKFMGDSLKRDKGFIVKANEVTPLARQYMDSSLKADSVFVSELAKARY